MTATQKSLQEEDVSGLDPVLGVLRSLIAPSNLSLQYEIFLFDERVCAWSRYLIQELHQAVTGGDSSVFCQAEEQGKWKLQPGVSFVFFTSHTPCESLKFLFTLVPLSWSRLIFQGLLSLSVWTVLCYQVVTLPLSPWLTASLSPALLSHL